MFKIREVKIGSGKTAVQVYYLNNRKRIFVKHIGSAMTKEDLVHLKQQARQFIEDYSGQVSLFPIMKPGSYSYLEQYECVGSCYDLCMELIC